MVVGFYGDVGVGIVYGNWALRGCRGRGRILVVGFYRDVVVGVAYGSWVLHGCRGRGRIW